MQITDVSTHARTRMQQRAVTPALLDLLDTYGAMRGASRLVSRRPARGSDD